MSHRPFLFLIIPLLLYILLAYFLQGPIWNDGAKALTHIPNKDSLQTYRLQLTDYPAEKAKTVLINASLTHLQDSNTWLPIQGNIKLYLQKDSLSFTLQPGDILLVNTTLQHQSSLNPDEFDYMNYLRLTGFCATAYADTNHYLYLEHQPIRTLRNLAIQCRQYLYNRYKQCGLTGTALGVVSALTLGYTEDLDKVTRQTFTAAGAAHILAVSGMHTAIIFAVLWSFLTLFGFRPVLYKDKKRGLRLTLICIIVLWFYAFLTGLTPSILRSVLMITLFLIGRQLTYQQDTYNTLFAATFIELLIYPLHLFTASFLLSYSAVFALIYLCPRFERWYEPKTKIGTFFWQTLVVSFAAQIGTLPLTLYLFGQTSNYFIITNIIVLGASYLVMIFAVLAILFLPIPYISIGTNWCLEKSTWLMIESASWIENIPHSVTYFQLSTFGILALYLAIITVCLYFKRKRWFWLIVSILLFLSIPAEYAYQLYHEERTTALIPFSASREIVLLHREGRNTTILTTDSIAAERVTANYRRVHHLHQPTWIILPEDKPYSFTFNNQPYILYNIPIWRTSQLHSLLPPNTYLITP